MAVEEMLRAEEEQLTFKPKTNYGARRSLVQRILREHSSSNVNANGGGAGDARMGGSTMGSQSVGA